MRTFFRLLSALIVFGLVLMVLGVVAELSLLGLVGVLPALGGFGWPSGRTAYQQGH